MFDIVRRRGYDARRVLIDSARVLDSPFDDTLICLTGAEQELLRNLTQYLHRQDTFVATYYANHYLTPDFDAWDAIQAIVASLEEKLMGNPNTLWGYSDIYKEFKYNPSIPAGEQTLYGSVVPEGEVWRVQNIACETDSTSCTSLRIVAYVDSTHIPIAEQIAPEAEKLYSFPQDVVLNEGDRLYCRFYDLTLNDDVGFYCTGYKMVVPVEA